MQIAKTSTYSIDVDDKKNRIYLIIKGFWKSVADDAPDYLSDIEKASQSVSPGFTILTDVREMKTPTPAVGELHKKAQKILIDAGLKKTAELVPESVIQQIALDSYARDSGMNKMSFSDQAEAETWLDS